MAVNDGDRVSTAKLLETLKGLQASRHLGSEPEVDPQTNEKTKHTIKQDYLPNADWNVNDPDADGYVEGRTHWVERTVGNIPVTTKQGRSTIPEMVKPEGFKVGTTTWKPDYEAIAFEGTKSGETFTVYLLAEDENGNQMTDASGIFDGETFYTGVCVVDFPAAFGQNTFVVIGKVNNTEITPDYVIGVGDVVHKLDRKFYDYTEPFDPTGYTKDSDISIKTMHGPTHSYNFVKLPNGLAYGNIKLHVDSWDDTTKTGTFSTLGTPLANPGSMIGGTAYVNGGIVFFTVEADGSNPRISNPIPSDLLVANRADMWIPQMFIRKEDE